VKLAELVRVLAELAGVVSLAYGSWLAWHPAGFIVPGALLVVLSIVADYRRSRAEADDAG
jgi:hypothetical protein